MATLKIIRTSIPMVAQVHQAFSKPYLVMLQKKSGFNSLFSEHNPFRKKPEELSRSSQQQFGSAEVDGSSKIVDAEFVGSNGDKLKGKKRRNRENNASLNLESADEASKTFLQGKKSKVVEHDEPNMGAESRKGGRRKSLDSESVSKISTDNGKEVDKHTNEVGKLNLDMDVETKSLPEDRNVGVKSSGTIKLEKEGKTVEKERKRKKRKRSEVEAEYEARRYGAVDKEEGAEGGLGGAKVGEKRKKLDNPEDTMASKEGFDDEFKLLRTVFVGNLPLKLKKKVLIKEFSKYGEVESVRIRSVPLLDSKKPRKGAIIKKQINDSADSMHAYVVFKTEESAKASLAHNMSMVGGHHIRVDMACPPRKKLKGGDDKLYDKKRTVFVGNLPFDVRDEELHLLFSSFNNLESSIEAIRVIRDPNTSVGKGIAYVLFRTPEAANLVVKKRHLRIRDRELRVFHVKSDSTPSKRKTPSSAETNSNLRKKLAVDTRTRGSKDWVKTEDTISYQGLRASKSGGQKKVHRKTVESAKSTLRTPKLKMPKERTKKRPAVAARKESMWKGDGASKLAGTKRKHENRTPNSAHRNKRAKRFK